MAITTPGAVDYHLSSQTGSLALNALNPLTLMCWINSTLWNGGNRVSKVGTYNTATSGGTAVQIGTTAGAGTADCWTWGGAVLVGTGGGTYQPVSGAWTHIAYTYDGTTSRIYINGLLSNSSTATPQLTGTLGAVYINGYPGGGTSETGAFSVDDVSYFNRTLSAAEVLTAYTTMGDKDGIWYGLVCSNLFSEGTPGSTANNCTDYSGNGNALTPIGAATGVNFTYSTSPVENDARMPLG